MARIEWLLPCEHAFFDRHARMCMVGVTTQLLLPSLPMQMRELTLVARLKDRSPGQALDLGIAILTPAGHWIGPSSDDNLHIEVGSDYILITLRDIPLSEEGLYRFGVHLAPEQFVAVDLPLFVVTSSQPAECH